MIAAFEITPRSPGQPGSGPEPTPAPVREPAFNAPWPPVVLAVTLVGAYAVQSRYALDYVAGAYGFSPLALAQGRWPTLFYSLFLHGNWAHVLSNAVMALAFGTPLARYFGVGLRGAALFFGFFLITGLVAFLAYAAIYPASPGVLVGASGAVSGFMGAAARLIAGKGRMGPILSRPVIGMGAAWVIANLLVGLIGGGALMPGSGGMPVAWQAHLIGFLAGVLLASPAAWLAGRR